MWEGCVYLATSRQSSCPAEDPHHTHSHSDGFLVRPQAGSGCGTDCSGFPSFLFLFCFTIALLRPSLAASFYICFHNTLQIAVFNNASLEALPQAFGASIIEAQHRCSVLIMFFGGVVYFPWLSFSWEGHEVFALAATGCVTPCNTFIHDPSASAADAQLSLHGLGRF